MANETTIVAKICLRQGNNDYCNQFNGEKLLLEGEPLFNTYTNVLKIGRKYDNSDNLIPYNELPSYYLGTEIKDVSYNAGQLTITKKSSGKSEEKNTFTVSINNISELQLSNELKKEIQDKYTMPDGGIPGTDLADGAVGTDQLAAAAISSIIGDAVDAAETEILPITKAKLHADLSAEIEAKADEAIIAAEFDSSTSYAKGKYVIYNGSLYRFTKIHSAGAWKGTGAGGDVESDPLSTFVGENASDIGSTISSLAKNYNHTNEYKQGDYCTYDRKIYRANQDVSDEEFTPAHWDLITNTNTRICNDLVSRMKTTDALEAIYSMLPTETQSGAAIYTALGADGVPVKRMTITASAAGNYTVNRVGKNLFEQKTDYSLIQKNITTPSGDRYGYKLQFPAGYYYGYAWVVNGAGSRHSNVMFGVFDSNGNDKTSERVMYSTGAMAPSHSTYGVAWVGITAVSANRDKVRIELADGEYILVYGSESYDVRGAQDLVKCNFMIIPGSSDPAIPTAPNYVNGIAPTQFPVTVTAADTPTDVPNAATMLGDNTFYTVPVTGITVTLDGTFRLDSTLIYKKLQQKQNKNISISNSVYTIMNKNNSIPMGIGGGGLYKTVPETGDYNIGDFIHFITVPINTTWKDIINSSQNFNIDVGSDPSHAISLLINEGNIVKIRRYGSSGFEYVELEAFDTIQGTEKTVLANDLFIGAEQGIEYQYTED